MDVLRTYMSPSRIGSPATLKGKAAETTPVVEHTGSRRQLFTNFCAWKVLLLVVAISSPGPGYDTSTRILLDSYPASQSRSGWDVAVDQVVSRLTRWDAIYFATSSERGHVLEQEWAFSPHLARITSSIARVVPSSLFSSLILKHAFVGIAVSHLSHCIAVFALFYITRTIIPGSHKWKHKIAITAACLHIVSPAGLFLSASFGESVFAFNDFIGMACYASSVSTHRANGLKTSWKAAFLMVLSGLLFGQAALVRSNGLLSGLIFAWDALSYLPTLPSIVRARAWNELTHLGAILLSGTILAAAYIMPQVEAYMEYCMDGNTRPWCEHTVPSIYTWVQSRYWNVGLFRYWTLSNAPLFALAAPMLVVLIGTSWVALNSSELDQIAEIANDNAVPSRDPTKQTEEAQFFAHVTSRFALPQLVLAVLAATSFHVQIINRISSGYPVWYILLAIALHTKGTSGKGVGGFMRMLNAYAGWIVRLMVMYAVVQGGLFASFLPPA